MQELRLTPTSYIVLGFASFGAPITPYELKQLTAASIGNFWTFPHTQLYTETDRLAEAGLLERTQESTGRRRKRYTITDAGRGALHAFLEAPAQSVPEIRDMATLQLFFGAAVPALAQAQVARYREKLAELEALPGPAASLPGDGPELSLRLGTAVTRAALAFWTELADVR